MRAFILALVVSLVALSFAPIVAEGQESGGSFGGSDWGSSDTGGSDWGSSDTGGSDWGSSGSSDWGSSDSSDYGSSDWGSSDGSSPGAGGSGLGCGCVIFGFILIALLLFFVARLAKTKRQAGRSALSGAPVRSPGGIRVAALSLGVDWRARHDLQALLERLAKTGDMGRPKGRADALREVVVALRRAEMAWLYVSPAAVEAYGMNDAQRVFTTKASEYRARFRREVVRNDQGVVQTAEAPEMKARADEGKGTVVVTIVVASRRFLTPVTSPDAANVRGALQALGSLTPNELIALEVIWSPAAEDDRMSTAELEQNYPEMRLIDPDSVAGRVFCVYCSGPFPMELLKCPHCGGPATDSQQSRTPPR